MVRPVAEIEKEVRELDRSKQERLLQTLFEELDGPAEVDADRAWLEEVQRRSADFNAGLMEVTPAEEVFERARARLKR